MEFQTRSEETGLKHFKTFEEALEEGRKDSSVWKISFTIPETNERIRLVKTFNSWIYQSIADEIGRLQNFRKSQEM